MNLIGQVSGGFARIYLKNGDEETLIWESNDVDVVKFLAYEPNFAAHLKDISNTFNEKMDEE